MARFGRDKDPLQGKTGPRHQVWVICNRTLWADKGGDAGGRQCRYEGAASYRDAGLLRQIQAG